MADGGRGLRTFTSIPQSLFLLIHLGYPRRRGEDPLEDHTHPALATEDGLQKALYRGLLTFGLSMLAMNLAIAGAALAVAQWMFN